MNPQVQKTRKICATCVNWQGLTKPLSGSYIEVQSGFYEKCNCIHPSHKSCPQTFQGGCGNYKPKY